MMDIMTQQDEVLLDGRCGAHCPGGKYRTDLSCNRACFANAQDPPQFFKDRFPHLWE